MMLAVFRFVLMMTLVCALAGSRAATADDASPSHPIVAGFERLYTDADVDAVVGGRLLLGELNCTSCHVADEKFLPHLNNKQAPVLDAVGSRVRPEFIRAYLTDPQAKKPGTTMPHVLAGLDVEKRAETVENLVHFLSTTGRIKDTPGDRRAVAEGKKLFEQVGCVACHGAREGGATLPTSIPLGDLASKYTIASLSGFLREPHKVRPSGRMPSLNLEAGEARSIAHYLLKDLAITLKPNLAYSYYDGSWEKLPNFATLTAKKTGDSIGFDLKNATSTNNFAMRFEGFLRIDAAKRYTFHITSDDGSILWVDDQKVADSDGIHPSQTGSGSVRLTPGSHKIVVGYFDGGGQTELDVEFEASDFPRQSIEGYLSLDDKPAVPDPKSAFSEFVTDAKRAEKGKALFGALGCASCHKLAIDEKPIVSTLAAKPLREMSADGGCLADAPPAQSPRYSLNERQRASIKAALAAMAKSIDAPTAKDHIAATMTTFNCYACHARDGRGGVEDERKPFFETTYADLGDEGKIPPHLNGVGTKLTSDWLAHILRDGGKDRPYMLTRMPKFGEDNVGNLAAKFEAVDPVAPSAKVELNVAEKRVKAIGRNLVGTQAFGCVQCHNFRGIPSNGVPALDMSIMTKRLRHDWFVQYVVNPQAYRPGTRMPSAWPEPQSQLADILDGKSANQIEAVWTYLSDGQNAQIPIGIGRSPIPLVAETEAVIYRGFIEGAGTRAIGVGFPEKANLAFDANEGRIALIWQGAFMDASRHWIGRGEGFQPPMGDNVLKLPSGASLAVLKDREELWPSAAPKASGYRFRGYRLTGDQRPTFLYSVGKIDVEDRPEAIAGKDVATLKRVLSLATHEENGVLYYRAAVAAKIEEKPDGWFAIDGEWSTRIEASEKPILRTSDGKQELLIPVKFVNAKASLTQIYQW